MENNFQHRRAHKFLTKIQAIRSLGPGGERSMGFHSEPP